MGPEEIEITFFTARIQAEIVIDLLLLLIHISFYDISPGRPRWQLFS